MTVSADHYQQCALPDCLNQVSTAKGICDECAGVGGGQA